MPKYMIERNILEVGGQTDDEIHELSEKACRIVAQRGGDVLWVRSFVTEDKIYCEYLAPSKEAIREHADLAGIPADGIAEVKATINQVPGEVYAGFTSAGDGGRLNPDAKESLHAGFSRVQPRMRVRRHVDEQAVHEGFDPEHPGEITEPVHHGDAVHEGLSPAHGQHN